MICLYSYRKCSTEAMAITIIRLDQLSKVVQGSRYHLRELDQQNWIGESFFDQLFPGRPAEKFQYDMIGDAMIRIFRACQSGGCP